MKITLLQEQYLPQVTEMIYQEFVAKTSSTATREVIANFLSQPADNGLPLTLIAVTEGVCIGTVSLFEQDFLARPQYSPWLASLTVDPDCRGQKIGTQLIEALQEIAREMGYSEIFLKTETVPGYYEKLGWQLVEEILHESGDISWLFKS